MKWKFFVMIRGSYQMVFEHKADCPISIARAALANPVAAAPQEKIPA